MTSLMHGLVSLPWWVIVPALLVLCLGTVAATRWAVPRVLGEDLAAGAVVASSLTAAFGALFAFLSAFLITNEWSAHNRAETAIANEAAAAARLAWAADAPGMDQGRTLAEVGAYLATTIDDDWPAMRQGRLEQMPSDAAYRRLEQEVRSEVAGGQVSDPSETELFAALDSLAQGRRDRLVLAERTMPAAIFAMVLISGLALIVNTVVLAAAHPWRAGRLVGLLAIVVALDLALVLMISGPFRGEYVASPRPLERVSAQIDSGWFDRP